jgi:hypothetical protein
MLTVEECFELMARIAGALFGEALEPSSGRGVRLDE